MQNFTQFFSFYYIKITLSYMVALLKIVLFQYCVD
jgi:hypothetical protein